MISQEAFALFLCYNDRTMGAHLSSQRHTLTGSVQWPACTSKPEGPGDSTRGGAASAAVLREVYVGDICYGASWGSPSPSVQCYLMDVSSSSLAHSITHTVPWLLQCCVWPALFIVRVHCFGKSALWFAACQPPYVCVLTLVCWPRVDLSTCLCRSVFCGQPLLSVLPHALYLGCHISAFKCSHFWPGSCQLVCVCVC